MGLDAKSLGVLVSLGISVGVLLLLLIIFEFLRRKLHTIYYYRNHASAFFPDHDGRPLGTAPLPAGFWPATVVPYKHAAIRESHGLDDVLFLRYLRTQAVTFFLIAVFAGAVLFPTYATAGNSKLPEGDGKRVVGLEVLSLANVPSRDGRLWAVLAAEIVVVVVICYMQRKDLMYYTKLRRGYRAAVRPANYAVVVADLPKGARGADEVFRTFDAIFPGEVEAVHPVRKAAKVLKARNAYEAAFMKREMYQEGGVKGETVKVNGELVDAGLFYRTAEEEAFAAAVEARADLDANAPVTHAAFVVFRSRKTATAAVNSPIAMNGMTVRRAPDPDAVFWQRLHPEKKQARMSGLVTYLLVFLMILFWFVPVAGVQLLSNLQSLGTRKGLGFIEDFRQAVPGLAKLVEGFLPSILLLVLNILVPIFVRLILGRARFFSRPNLDAAVFRWVFLFYLATTFLGNIVVGSLLSALETLTDDPSLTLVVDLLSNRIPAQSSFFLNYVALSMGISAGFSILMFGKLFCRPYCMAGAKSERLHRKKSDAFSAFPWFKQYSICSLHVLIATVYSVVAPLTAVFVCLGFCALYMTLKHVVLYSSRPLYYSAGRLFRTAWEHSFFSLFLHQVILIGLFSLKKMAVLAVLQGVVLVATLVFARHVRRKCYPFAAHGALGDLVSGDNDASRDIPAHYADLFIHPALQGEIGDIATTDAVRGGKKEGSDC